MNSLAVREPARVAGLLLSAAACGNPTRLARELGRAEGFVRGAAQPDDSYRQEQIELLDAITRELRARPRDVTVPVTLLRHLAQAESPYNGRKQAEKWRRNGGCETISKPRSESFRSFTSRIASTK